MTTERMINVESLRVDPALHAFIEQEALPGTGVSSPGFWQGLSTMVHTLGPRNRELLITRNRMQLAIDAWHLDRNGRSHDPDEYRSMLRDIGYLVDEGDDFEIEPTGVDPEIANIAGPQLIVPVTNARYALNAANARWGSLYDALYGTDALGTPPPDGPYRRERGGEVVAWVRQFLDDSLPLRVGSHRDVIGYVVEPATDGLATLVTTLADGRATGPIDASAFVGFTGSQSAPTTILLEHHGLGIEIAVDRNHPVGASDLAGVCDVLIESAVTVVMDFEDSVATVDGSDKVAAYRNWLGMMRGDLAETVTKNDSTFVRSPSGRRPPVHCTRWIDGHPPRPLAVARPQRRPPDDDPSGDRSRRTRGAGRVARRNRHSPRSHARSRPASRAPQPPCRIGLHRQTQDARPRRGGIHR